jgi:2-methylcitrate dehydratase PrpD
MGIAYHQCSGNGQCVNEGAVTKRMGPGFSARGGIVAALMAEKGITGARECIEGELGIFNLYHKGEYDPAPLTADLGKRFAGLTAGMKPYPCCKGTHSYVDVALAMVDKHRIKGDDIQEITIFAEDDTYVLLHPLEKRRHPENPVDSQFSIPWAVAVVFARGRAGIGDFTEEAIRSRDILDIADKIKVVKDKSLTRVKGIEPAKIAVTTRQGKTRTEQTDIDAESSQGTLPFSAYERKFRDCAAYSLKPLSGENTDRVVELLGRLEDVADIRELVELLG